MFFFCHCVFNDHDNCSNLAMGLFQISVPLVRDVGRDLELVAYTARCYASFEKKYKEITKELHGLERPWAPAGLPGGWRDSGRAPRQPVVPSSRPRGIKGTVWRRDNGLGVAGKRKSVEAMDWVLMFPTL